MGTIEGERTDLRADEARTRLPLILIAAALVLAIGSALLLWPGIVVYDTVHQYRQALVGEIDDWHPPVMARLWQLLLWLRLGGSGPLLLIQLGLYWGGIGLIAAALARIGARRAGWATLLAGLSPLVVDWLVVVIKDAQMIAAMVGAIGLVGWYRLQGLALPRIVVALVVVLLGYAMLARVNAVFAVVPLALALGGWAGLRRWPARAAMLLLCTLLAIGGADVVNHRLLGAERSHVERTQVIFDLAGIAHYAHLSTMPGVPEPEWVEAERKRCLMPFYWDPFGDSARCGAISSRFLGEPGSSPILRDWIVAIATHPIAYAEHRLAHLNATLRIGARYDERSASAPGDSEPNTDGLGRPGGPLTHGLQRVAAAVAETPLGSPAVWLVAAAAIGWTLRGTARQPARDLGLALLLSAMLMTASFAVVSIASDLRYHLWLMAATGLAAVLLAGCTEIDRRRLRLAVIVVAVACVASVVARAYGVRVRF